MHIKTNLIVKEDRLLSAKAELEINKPDPDEEIAKAIMEKYREVAESGSISSRGGNAPKD